MIFLLILLPKYSTLVQYYCRMSFNLLVFDDDEEEELLFLFHSCTFLIQSPIHFGSCCFLSVFFVQFLSTIEADRKEISIVVNFYIIISSICLVLGYQGVLP